MGIVFVWLQMSDITPDLLASALSCQNGRETSNGLGFDLLLHSLLPEEILQ